MKAIIREAYGGPEVLKIKSIPKPTLKDDEILVRNYATSVNSGDVKMRSLEGIPVEFKVPALLVMGINKPKNKILGGNFAGQVERVGKNVTLFKKGDKVFGTTDDNFGASTQYLSINQHSAVDSMPKGLTYEKAVSLLFGAETAHYFFTEKVQIKKGDKVLINGASGAVGSAAIQLAKYYGAEVTGVCSSSNVKLVKSLGADFVIDYTKEDFTKNKKKYDIIFDTVGKITFSHSKSALKKTGKFVMTVFRLSHIVNTLFNKQIVTGVLIKSKKKDITFLKGLAEKKKLKPVVDKIYPLKEVAKAHKHVDSGHKKGNVILSLK